MLGGFLIVCACLVPVPDDLSTLEWPHLRGPHGDGTAVTGGMFAAGAAAAELAWSIPLGSGYSGVAVAGQRGVTMFSDGESDHVVGFDPAGGAERWRVTLGPTYRGHDGSEDGPISSPVIAGASVFALDARGRLRALDLESGEERWSRDLRAEFGAAAPEYGFATTPVVEEGLVLVQAGGSEGRHLCALDAATGELRWSVGDGAMQYQSPALLSLLGRRQLVVLGEREIFAVEPRSGAVLWRHALGERDDTSSGIAGRMDDAHFWAPVSGQTAVFEVAEEAGSVRVTELFRTRELGGTYAAPVYREGYFYGFRRDFLSCVDATNGARVWTSRPPGGRGLILVDDRLVVFGATGELVVVRATPEGYQEEARVAALETTSFTWPSFAGGHVFLRNSTGLASVRLGARDAVAVTAPAAEPGSHAFGRFLQQVLAAERRQEMVDEFFARQEAFPLVEGDWVHFVYRGDHQDVAIAGSMIDGSTADPLQRLPGTDLYYRSYPIEPGARWEYRFQVDYDRWLEDPLNPRKVPGPWGDAQVSEVLTPGYVEATHLQEPTGARGRLESYEFHSELLGNDRKVQVYLPVGYDGGEARYPLLLVHQGSDWLERGLMASTLDNLVGTAVEPLVVVFVDPIEEWWFESGGTGTEEYLEMLAREFVPDLEERYRLEDSPEARALMGTEGFGLTAVYATLLHPDVFGKAAAQSAFLGDVARHAFFELLERQEPQSQEYYVDWERYAARNKDRGYDHGADSQRLAEALRARGYPVHGGEALDGHGWGSLRARTDRILTAFFPKTGGS